MSLVDTFALAATIWPWVYAVAGVLAAAGAIAMLVYAGRWPVRTARFERGAVGAGPDLADDPARAWHALDAGEDPTVSESATAAGGRPEPPPDPETEPAAGSPDPDVQSRSTGDTMGSQGGSTTRREPS